MRALLVVVVLVLILGVVGWLQFSSPDGDPTIRVDIDKASQDTSSIVEESKVIADDAKRNIDQAAQNIDASIDREPVDVE